jgi:hypothetical protein
MMKTEAVAALADTAVFENICPKNKQNRRHTSAINPYTLEYMVEYDRYLDIQ